MNSVKKDEYSEEFSDFDELRKELEKLLKAGYIFRGVNDKKTINAKYY